MWPHGYHRSSSVLCNMPLQRRDRASHLGHLGISRSKVLMEIRMRAMLSTLFPQRLSRSSVQCGRGCSKWSNDGVTISSLLYHPIPTACQQQYPRTRNDWGVARKSNTRTAFVLSLMLHSLQRVPTPALSTSLASIATPTHSAVSLVVPTPTPVEAKALPTTTSTAVLMATATSVLKPMPFPMSTAALVSVSVRQDRVLF